MKRTAVLGIALIITPFLGLAEGGTNPAEAAVGWFVGGDFNVGGVHFSLAFDGLRHYRQPYYYYRTAYPIRHRGYQCGAYCFKQGGYVYHHPSCPLVLHHFRSNRFDPVRIWRGVRVPPSFRGYWAPPGHYSYRGRVPYYYYYGRGYDDRYGYGYVDPRDHRGRGRHDDD